MEKSGVVESLLALPEKGMPAEEVSNTRQKHPLKRLGILLAVTFAFLLVLIIALSAAIGVLHTKQNSAQHILSDCVQNCAEKSGKDDEVPPPCGDDWIWYRNKCYYFSEAEGNWTEAKDLCAALNSSLAMIDTRKELDFIVRLKGHFDYWIGLRKAPDETWKWTNGSEFKKLFPIGGGSSCTYLNHLGASSGMCHGTRHWICTKESNYSQRKTA